MDVKQHGQSGVWIFSMIWLGQFVSLIGSNLTGFAIGVWVYQSTESVTLFSLIAFFTVLPGIIITPLAGIIADRWDRWWIMILGDTGAALSTLTIAMLLFADRLDVWHLYLVLGLSSACSSLQWPAYITLTTLLVPTHLRGRASGLNQLADGIAQIIAPGLGSFLVLTIGLSGVIVIDVLTFGFQVVVLLLVRLPKLPATAARAVKTSFVSEATSGWTYIAARPGLVGLLVFVTLTTFSLGLVQVLLTPLVLSIADIETLGVVLTTVGIGLVGGSILMSVWGGPKRLIRGVLGFTLIQGLVLLLGGVQPSPLLIASAAAVFSFTLPVILSCNHVIWQNKVPLALQGRVFATRRMFSLAAAPLAYMLAGPLTTDIFEPLLAPGGRLSSTVGQAIGVGPGRGIGLLLIALGALTILTVVIGYLYAPVYKIETRLPDHPINQPDLATSS